MICWECNKQKKAAYCSFYCEECCNPKSGGPTPSKIYVCFICAREMSFIKISMGKNHCDHIIECHNNKYHAPAIDII